MTEQLWRRCPKAVRAGGVNALTHAAWSCRCHGPGNLSLLPVAVGALLIEDGFDAALERWCADFYGDEWAEMPEGTRASTRRMFAYPLRAAVGGQP